MDPEDPNDCEEKRLPALTVVRDMLRKHRHHVAALEQMEKMLVGCRLEDGSPLEEMLWTMLQRSPLNR